MNLILFLKIILSNLKLIYSELPGTDYFFENPVVFEKIAGSLLPDHIKRDFLRSDVLSIRISIFFCLQKAIHLIKKLMDIFPVPCGGSIKQDVRYK